MKKLSLVLTLVCFAFGFAMAQRTVSGTVVDEKGEALIGASILAKGTSTGTVTDVDGKYSLLVPAGSNVLIVSYTGFSEQEVTLGASNLVDVTMKEGVQIDEVLVTAVGIQREKKALGYSVTDLAGDELAQRSEPDPVRAVAGKVPGVQITGAGGAPGQSTKINIRGNSSLTGNTQPLFVVDGIPFDNSVNATTGSTGGSQYSSRSFDIDPNNIESMTILKGAAAAALYGSRATNGVVVITTKSGSKKARKGLEVSYNSSFQLEQISGIPDYQNVYGQGANQVYNGGFIGNWGSPFPTEVDRLNSIYGTTYSKVNAAGYPEGTIPHPLVSTGYAAPRFSNVFPELFETLPDGTRRAMPVPYRPYEIIDNFFETGQLWENSLTINAGGPENSLSGTVSRMTNQGIAPNTEASRTSLSFGGNSKLANGLIVSGNVTYVNTTQANPPSAGAIYGGNFGALAPSIFTRLFYQPRNFDLTSSNAEGIPYPFENPVDGSNVFYRALDNPLWLAKYSRYNSDVNRVYGNIALSYDVLPWLNLTARGGLNTYTDSRKSILRPGGTNDANGYVWTDDVTNREVDLNYLATVSTNITQDIDFRLIGGLNLNQREFKSRYVEGDNVISPGLYNTGATASQFADETNRKQRFYAAYADLQLGYKNFLYLGATARNDWSSTLPEGKNSFFYPGVNASFVFSDAFGLSNNIFSYGKVRAAWTQVGNEASPYQTATTYRLGIPHLSPSGGIFNRATLDGTLGNAELRNELTTEIEFGADLRFFRNRLGLDVTYFKRNSTDQITSSRLPASTGFTEAIVNAGEIENKGWEIALNLTPIRTAGGFEWNTLINFTKIESLVIDAGEGTELYLENLGITWGGGGTVHREGFPYGQIIGSAPARTNSYNADGDYIGEGDLLINKALGTYIVLPNLEIIGDPNPDFLMGIVNTFSYKGLAIQALIDWRQGGDLFFTTAGDLMLRGQLKLTEDREALRVVPGVYGDPATFEPVTDENGNLIKNTTTITSFDYHFIDGYGSYGADETNVYDVTTIRLREVSLSYEFPKKLLEKTPFGSARLSVSGRNLWFKSPNVIEGLNMDPEVLGETAGSNVQGFEYSSYPTTRRYGVNLSVTF